MKRQPSLVTPLLVLSLLAPAFSQTPQRTPAPQTPQPSAAAQQPVPAATPTPTPQEESDEDVVRITTNLVQFDAVVTDKQGRPVTDLRPEDFEVYANGRKQEVTNFSYISTEAGAPAAAQPAAPSRRADKTAPPVPPARLRPGQVRRTVALVVDDLGTSFESLHFVRQALKKFVDEQMQPGDLVAIMRTSAGMGALQQFTNDKRMLYRAIERVRWYPQGRSGTSAFAPMEGLPPSSNDAGSMNVGDSKSGGGGDSDGSSFGGAADASADMDEFRDEIFSVGTLGAVNFIVRGMMELPGRKSVVMFSDGFGIYNRKDPSKGTRVIDKLRRLVDLANRASVVIYAVDARGLPCLCLTAADNTAGRSMQQVQQALDDRRASYLDTQSGPDFLAAQTGGFLVHDNNDLSGAVRRVLEDQRGYYLIGFRRRPERLRHDQGTQAIQQPPGEAEATGPACAHALRLHRRHGRRGQARAPHARRATRRRARVAHRFGRLGAAPDLALRRRHGGRLVRQLAHAHRHEQGQLHGRTRRLAQGRLRRDRAHLRRGRAGR